MHSGLWCPRTAEVSLDRGTQIVLLTYGGGKKREGRPPSGSVLPSISGSDGGGRLSKKKRGDLKTPRTSPKCVQWNSGPSDLSRLCWQALTRQTAAGGDGSDPVAAKARESTGDCCHGNSHRCHAGTGERETDVTGDRVAGADFPDIVTLKAELEKVGKFPRGESALAVVTTGNNVPSECWLVFKSIPKDCVFPEAFSRCPIA